MKASVWHLRAAKEGERDADAQFYTVQRYRSGTGHDAPNIKEAVKWYQAAVAQGHCGAALQLASCYDTGDGVKRKPGLALKLWRKCAKHVHETGDNGTEARRARRVDRIATAHHKIGSCYCLGSNGVEVDMHMTMKCWTQAAEQGSIGMIYLMGFIDRQEFVLDVPVGTFVRDVPLRMKYLRVLTFADRNRGDDSATVSRAEAWVDTLILDFHAVKSCMGCGSPKARKLCSGCLDFDHTKVRHCGEACQLIHWRHQAASHKYSAGLVPPPATAPGRRRAEATCVNASYNEHC
jgi:TPR repeat protein